MPRLDEDTVVRRVEAVRLSRVSIAMDGWHEHPDHAEVLDAFTRGEIDAAELLRQVNVDFRGRADK